jgi:hypothetical protein
MTIRTISVDLAKRVFQVYAVKERAAAVLRELLERDGIAPLLTRLVPCLSGAAARMAGRPSSLHWGIA